MGRVAELGDLDVNTEDGYREFTRVAMRLLRDLAIDLEFVSAVVGTALENTPTVDPTLKSRVYARKVRGYLRRAAQMQIAAAGQISGAFRTTEEVFIPRPAKAQPGMQMNNRQSA